MALAALHYAIFTFNLVEAANTLIRDGLIICGTKTRPKKEKCKPIQCMKCRRWGHFATECPATMDTCGTCREEHRTSHCSNREKKNCVSCGVNTHMSWDRNCPEFVRRCAILDERNPQNTTVCHIIPQSMTGPSPSGWTEFHSKKGSQENTWSTKYHMPTRKGQSLGGFMLGKVTTKIRTKSH